MIRIIIEGDMTTGLVKVQGPIEEPRVWHWMLGEAQRVCERHCNALDAEANTNGGPRIMTLSELPPGFPHP